MSSEAVSAAASPTALQAELQQFDADYIAAFDAGNAQALVALFTEDPVVMNTFGTIVSGRSVSQTKAYRRHRHFQSSNEHSL